MSENKEPIKNKIIDIILNFRVWILIIFLILSYFAINPASNTDAIVINGIIPGTAAANAGIEFNSNTNPTNFEEILYFNNQKITSEEEFYAQLTKIKQGDSINLKTNKNKLGYTINLPNENKTIKELLGISIKQKDSSNIRLGIELEGGSRLILKPKTNISEEQYDMLITNLQNRLDVYGASGTKVNKLEDAFSNEKFVIVESISANKNDIFELISRQGEFKATIANETVFTGNNVLQVFTDPQNARLESCSPNQEGEYICTYAFLIEIDSKSAETFFDITSNLNVIGTHLSEKIAFYLDDQKITELGIASTFKYNKITNPQITVSGNYQSTQAKALESAKKEMKFLQTVLSTQSLPTELEVLQSYSISSTQGEKLLSNAAIVAIAAVLLVSSIVAIRYKHPFIFIAIFIALLGEVIIVFGIAAFMKLSIDLAAIGGLIAAIGTGVDDQIIITDEYFRKRKKKISSKKKIKTAIYIIMIAYTTTLAAMIPLTFAGLKILQGFAFMIIIGVTVGVFITRPAYASMLRTIMTTRKQRKEEEKEDF